MNSAWWFIAGVFTGWIVTCLAIAIPVNDSRCINRLRRRLGSHRIIQPQNQDLGKRKQIEQHQQQGKSQGNSEQ